MDKESVIKELLSSSSSSSSGNTAIRKFMEVITSDDESGEEFSELKKIFARENKQSVSNFVEDVVHKYSEDEVSTYNYFISNKKFISNVFVFSFDAIFGFRETQQIMLCEQFANSRHFKKRLDGTGGRKGISAEAQCLAFLW